MYWGAEVNATVLLKLSAMRHLLTPGMSVAVVSNVPSQAKLLGQRKKKVGKVLFCHVGYLTVRQLL